MVAGGLTTTATGAIIADTPGLNGIDDRFEARIRLDQGNSRTWKSAYWEDSTLIKTSGNFSNPDVWNDAQTYDFTFSYTASTGAASLVVEGLKLGSTIGDLTLTETINLTPGEDFAGFRLLARSNNDGSVTTFADLQASLDGGTAQSVPTLVSGAGQSFVEPSVWYYFDEAVDNLTITGTVNFDWADGSNLNNERFKVGIKVLEGDLVPAPGAFALAGMAGLVGIRRRR
ncbi:MAG: hypothetical protein AAGD00_00265 [Planctomycetota bacterium]